MYSRLVNRLLGRENRMSISTQKSSDGKVLTIKIQGRFDFSSHQEFRDAYESADSSILEYHIDMSETTYLDSSALEIGRASCRERVQIAASPGSLTQKRV